MYGCLFADSHVSLPFDAFTTRVLRELNVAPTRLHPDLWAYDMPGVGACSARADARKGRMEEISHLEHELREAGHNLKEAVEANTTYEKRLCAQAAELELRQTWLTKLEKSDADKAAEVVLLRKELEAADRRATRWKRKPRPSAKGRRRPRPKF
ncbi:hypothetical protein ACSQ67_005802 [Phaseolus vulgaris]